MTETLGSVGEFGLIQRIQAVIEGEGVRSPGVTLGIGDDAASFSPREGHELLVTCDCIVEGRHYLPQHISPFDLGRRSMTLNISDIGAMGGQPLYALVSLGLRGDTPVPYVEAMYRGFIAELSPLGASIIGGNLTKSAGALFIDITLIGEVERGRIVRRCTAREGDVVLVTGYPGQAAAGLAMLVDARFGEELGGHPLVKAYNTPSHRALEGRAAARSGCATAMIDTSDGFAGDLGHICEESGVGAELTKENLPLSDALCRIASRLGKDPYDLFFQDSDDYELIITCRPDDVDTLRTLLASVRGVPVARVGVITAASEGVKLILPDGSRSEIRGGGWDHFKGGGH